MLEQGVALLTSALLALFLIAEVAAISHIIAQIFARNAFTAAATEMIWRTLAQGWRLVAAIATLLLPVARLFLQNATMILAHEMRLWTLA